MKPPTSFDAETEFDPSNLEIDKDIFDSFKSMMEEKSKDPEMNKLYEEMMKGQGGMPGMSPEQELTIDIDEEDQADLDALNSVKASDTVNEIESGPESKGRQRLDQTAKDIFGKKK